MNDKKNISPLDFLQDKTIPFIQETLEHCEVILSSNQQLNFLNLDLVDFQKKYSDEFLEKLPSLLPNKDETHFIEFKQEVPKHIIKEMVGFANSNSGIIYIGVKDDGGIIGVKNVDKTQQKITNQVRACKPPLTIEIRPVKCKNGETILLVLIPKTRRVIQTPNGKFLRRIGNDTHPLESIEIKELERQKKVEKLGFLFQEILVEYLSLFKRN